MEMVLTLAVLWLLCVLAGRYTPNVWWVRLLTLVPIVLATVWFEVVLIKFVQGIVPCMRPYPLKVGDLVLWNDPWREEWEIPDERVWEVYEVREDMAKIFTGEIGTPDYSEAEVPYMEMTKLEG
jgi:hypothetical protein